MEGIELLSLRLILHQAVQLLRQMQEDDIVPDENTMLDSITSHGKLCCVKAFESFRSLSSLHSIVRAWDLNDSMTRSQMKDTEPLAG